MNRALGVIVVIVAGAVVTRGLAQIPNIPVAAIPNEQSETAIAQSNSDANLLIAAWNDFPAGVPPAAYSRAGYSFSTDAGNTWKTPTILTQPYNSGFDPSVAFNGSIALYCRGVNFDAGESGDVRGGQIWLSYTSDHTNWQGHAVSTLSVKQDKPFLAVNHTQNHNGRAYVSWVDFSEQDPLLGGKSYIRFKYADPPSYDNWQGPSYLAMEQGGSNLQDAMSYPTTSITNQASGAFVQCPIPVVGPDGTIYVAWVDYEAKSRDNWQATGSIYVAKSTDYGVSFSSPYQVAHWPYPSLMFHYTGYGNGLLRSSFPTIAVSPTNEYVYLAYTVWGASTSDIYYHISTNHGSSWSAAIRATESWTADEFSPWLSVSSSGNVFLAYYRGYWVSSNCYLDLYVAKDFTSPNTKVSSPNGMIPFSAQWGSDYVGIAALTGSHAIPVWADYRNGSSMPDIYCGLYGAPTPPTGVTISGSTGQHPTISWSANSESDMAGYKLFRKILPDQSVFSLIATMGTSTRSYTDNECILRGTIPGQWANYYVTAFDLTGFQSNPSGYVSRPADWRPPKIYAGSPETPVSYMFEQNYPNPFNPTTVIRFALRARGHVTLGIYDVLGKQVAALVSGYREAGYQSITWDAKGKSSGLYYARLIVTDDLSKIVFTKTNKLLLAK